MMKQTFRGALLGMSCLLAVCCGRSETVITGMRCEYLAEPIGVDVSAPRLTWTYESGEPFAQTKCRVLVATSPQLLAGERADVWISDWQRAAESRMVFDAPEPLESYTRYYWCAEAYGSDGKRVCSPVASFETAAMEPGTWPAGWITDGHDKDYKPAPLFRKPFSVTCPVRRARLYVSAAGYCEMALNGEKIGKSMLDPAYTHFDKRMLYSSYDVTGLLQSGDNVLSAVLGNGWYNVQTLAVWRFDEARWRNRPRMSCQLRIDYADGSGEVVCSDSSWKTATGGTLSDDLYSGVRFDARLEPEAWRSAGFDDGTWASARMTEAPAPLLQSQLMPPIRATREVPPVAAESFGDSVRVFDLGTNLAGVCRLRVKGGPGTKIRLRHGEELTPEGRVYQGNVDVFFQRTGNDAPPQRIPGEEFQTDTYVLQGGDWEEFTPAFTYHGFRYVEAVSDGPVTFAEEGLTGLFLHTDVESVGTFECSNPLLNRIWEAARRSYLSNLHGIPTDCPQREKNGWTADAYLAVNLALLNYDGIKVYEKWMRDFVDNQREDGCVSGIVPSAGWGYGDWIGPVWDAALFVIPDALYRFYGDTRCIDEVYETCRRYLEYIATRETDGLLRFGLGDWLTYKATTPNAYTSSCFYYYDNVLMARFAELTGNDPAPYRAKAETLKGLINREFFDSPSATYANGTQTAQALALYLGIVPEGRQQAVADRLAAMVRSTGHHLDFGTIGSVTVLHALTQYGYVEDAYRMASQRTAPSWGAWMEDGLTTLAETWVLSPTQDASRNHVFFGDVSAWMVGALAGIDYLNSTPGFRHVVIRPRFPEGLDHARAEYRSVNGPVSSSWERRGNRIRLKVEIPPNVTATVWAGGPVEVSSGTHGWTFDVPPGKFSNVEND